jgi:hypothetical protein
MSLENLLKIGQLKSHPPDRREIQKLLVAAQRNLADVQIKGISAETRFDVTYKAIMQAALAALMANGYRPDTNRPGHHMTVIQSLPLTVGLKPARAIVLDTLRRKRNLSDYTGADIDDVSAEAHLRQDNCSAMWKPGLGTSIRTWREKNELRHRPETLELLQHPRDDGLSYGDYPSTALGTGSEQLTVLLFKMLNE